MSTTGRKKNQTDSAPSGPLASNVDSSIGKLPRPILGPSERVTGRYLILLNQEEEKDAQNELKNRAGIKLSSVGGSETHPLDDRSIPDGEGIIFHELGVAVVSASGDQSNAISAAVAASPSLHVMEPERVVRTYGAVDLTYLRGYRDAVNHLYERLGGDETAAIGAAGSDVVYDETQIAWGLQATRASSSPFTGRGIKVAVLDTGIDLEHQDFSGRTIISQSFIQGEGVQDGNGHGTHCCGIACGARRPQRLPRYGIAYEADLYVGKVLNDEGRGTDSTIIAGLQWAIAHACDIVSMSLGGPVEKGQAYSAIFQQIAKRALDRGVLIVAAAGNDSQRERNVVKAVSHPANCPDIFAVAALDRRLKPAWFSNAGLNPGGGKIDIAAPGVDVKSSWRAPDMYKEENGTSMATPHVAGIAALFKQRDPSIAGRALWAYILQRAKPLSDESRDVGAGLVQAPLTHEAMR